MHKSEVKVTIKEQIMKYPPLKRLLPKFDRKMLWSETSTFLTFFC